ncbi:MAG: SUMF1/EgtB/PvdO family nonheme iron enzyme [Microvirga sp.]
MSQAALRHDQDHGPKERSHADLLRIPGSTFRMESPRPHAGEAPVHPATVDAFRIDPAPVTDRQFRDVGRAIGPVTAARHPQPVDTATSHVGFRCIMQERKIP